MKTNSGTANRVAMSEMGEQDAYNVGYDLGLGSLTIDDVWRGWKLEAMQAGRDPAVLWGAVVDGFYEAREEDISAADTLLNINVGDVLEAV